MPRDEILLVDIGNTRIKWARLSGTSLGEQSAAPHAAWTADTFIESILNPGARADRVLIGNVGGARMADVARNALSKAWSIEPELIHSTSAAGGIRNSYPEPAKLGVDRWLAMIGARSIDHVLTCVVSVGTAMTIDGLDTSGTHLGGLIVPGPELMVSSLLKHTSEIARRAEQGTTADRLFADNTLGAIHQGAEQALAALVERTMFEMEGDSAQSPSLLLTGGAVARVAKLIRWPHEVIPDLVLRGLAVLAAERV